MKTRTIYKSLALSFLACRLAVSTPVYIANSGSFPAYPYNTSSYKQSGAFVGCGPTTGAMIFAYFAAVKSASGLLTSPGTGTDKGLNTAWALHGSTYMNTQTDGYGSVYNIKSGLEGYAKAKGCTVKVVIHVGTSYSNPSSTDAAWLNAYGSYGDAWTNDGTFWKNTASGSSIDTDKFCDFAATFLSQGIPIFLTIDTKAAGTGDHWVPMVGYDKSAKQYAYYDTYDTSVHWADIYYSGDPAGKKANSIVMVRTVAYTSGGGGGGGSIAVTSPNGGEKWSAGSQQNITWTGSGIDNYDVKIEYSTNNGSSYNFITWTTNHGTSGSYAWTVPNGSSSQCLVRLSVQQTSVVSDVSNAVFQISQTTLSTVFNGHVYQGNPPDATHPVSGVTVELNGDTDEWPTLGKKFTLTSAVTDASGAFSLTLASGNTGYNYYHIEETDPSGVYSVGAQAPSPGYVKNYNAVSFQGSTLTLGTTYNGIGFWDVSSGGGGGTGASGRIVVTTTAAFGSGSLGDAIAGANTHAGIDTILFNIPKTDPNYNSATGVWTIAPTAGFQGIGDAGVVINGFSQRDFIGQDTNPDGPEIQVIGTGAPAGTDGLYATASRVEISGMAVCGFRVGIALMGVQGGRIAGCYLGTNAKGDKATPNQDGIWLGQRTRNVTIEPANFQPSLISGNTEAGIVFSDTCARNAVRGSIIGMDRTEKNAIPNGSSGGICSRNGCFENVIAGNHISGNKQGVNFTTTHGDTVVQNWIGTDPSWMLAMGNTGDGVLVDEASDGNVIVENLIGRNGGVGIRVIGMKSVHNKLVRNLVSMNSGGGISNESGGNAELPAPVISAVTPSSVAGMAGPNALVQIFTDSGNQGAQYQGDAKADASGHFAWNGTFAGPLHNVTTIAIDPSGNTSSFSAPSAVTGVADRESAGVPGAFRLSQNYPNPFNPSTTIDYALPRSERVRIAVYDLQGRHVKTLVDGMQAAGRHKTVWNGTDARDLPQPAGVYCCRMETDSEVRTIKLSMVK
jgi:hypothetical protein